MVQSDAERELSGKYPVGANVTYMDPSEQGTLEELVLRSGIVNGDAVIHRVRRQVLDSEGEVIDHEPYDLGYVPVYGADDRIRFVAVPNIVEVQ